MRFKVLKVLKRLGLNLKARFRISFFTSLIEDDILQEMGFEPSFELEKYVDDPGFLANFLSTE